MQSIGKTDKKRNLTNRQGIPTREHLCSGMPWCLGGLVVRKLEDDALGGEIGSLNFREGLEGGL